MKTYGIDVILGLQWGDEGKGKIVDYLVQKNDYDIVARFQGGCNAGHTIIISDDKYVTHLIPAGVFSNKIGFIGAGVVIDPITLWKEIQTLLPVVDIPSLLRIAAHASLTLPTHCWLDKAKEHAKGKAKIGSTLKGIGPTYMDKTGRNALCFGMIHHTDFREKYDALKAKHLQLLKLYPETDFPLSEKETAFFAAIEALKKVEVVSAGWIHEQLKAGKKILAEGAQGTLLDIDHGTYPYVTSSNTTIAGVCSGLGVSHKDIGTVYGVVKAYTTRVGNGPFPTKLADTDGPGATLRKAGHEFGATTGRPRDCGWLDIPLLRHACRVSGVDKLIVTKIDVMDTLDEIKVCTHHRYEGVDYDVCHDVRALDDVEPIYETYPGWNEDTTQARSVDALPDLCRTYLNEAFKGLPPICLVANGPERESIIVYDRIAVDV